MPILEDQLMAEDFSKFEEWFKTVESHNSNWFGDEPQSELTETDSASSPYFYSNSTDDVFSERSPLDSGSSSTLSPIESTDFLFDDTKTGTFQFPSIGCPFDSFEFNRPVDEIIGNVKSQNIGEIFPPVDEHKFVRTKPVRTGKNQLGGSYFNGRPLPTSKRLQIIEMSNQGIKPCQVSRALKVSHGCVSKILSKYQKTGILSPGKIGGSKPKKSLPEVVDAIAIYKQIRPSIYSWEIREQLIRDQICQVETCPSVSSINRIIRTKLTPVADKTA